jgi:hypothetical protein
VAVVEEPQFLLETVHPGRHSAEHFQERLHAPGAEAQLLDERQRLGPVAAEAQKLVAWLKSGKSDVMLPGEPERRARIKRATSIPIDAGNWSLLVELAKSLGVAVPV